MKRNPKRRSAIVPGIVFAFAVAGVVVPNLAGCQDEALMLGVAADFGQVVGFDVAAVAFDMSFSVAADAFGH